MSIRYRVPRRFTTGLQPASLPFSASGFSGTHKRLLKIREATVHPHDLVRVAVHLGHPWARGSGATLDRPKLRKSEIAYRASVVRAFLETHAVKNGHVWRASEAYLEGLESTEKGGVGYALGMMFAVALAEQLLRAPHSLHVSVYADGLGIVFPAPAGRKRARTPDLLLRDRASALHALEAKARFAPGPKAWTSAMDGALEQARALDRYSLITGARVASGLQIAEEDGALSMEWIDPPVDGHAEGSIDHATFMRAYYERIGNFLMEARPTPEDIAGRPFVLGEVPQADLHLGLATDLFSAVAESDWSALLGRAIEQPAGGHDDNWSIGGDGVVVVLGQSWRSLASDDGA